MEIFLGSKRALPWFLNEENLEQIEQKTRLNRDSCAEREKDQRKKALERNLARALCARIYIHKYRFNLFSTRFSLSFFPSLSFSLSRVSSFIARYRVKRL